MEHSGGEADSLGHVLCAGSSPLLQSIFCTCLNPFITLGPGGEDAPVQPFSQSLLQRVQHPGAVGGAGSLAQLGLLW